MATPSAAGQGICVCVSAFGRGPEGKGLAVVLGQSSPAVSSVTPSLAQQLPIDSIVVRIHACALGATDVRVLNGGWSDLLNTPLVPGYAISGVVEAAGRLAQNSLPPGTEGTCALPADSSEGGCAERITMSMHHAFPKPRLCTHVQVRSSALKAALSSSPPSLLCSISA